MGNKKTKTYLILEYMILMGVVGITQWDAIRIAKYTRLSALMHTLRAKGVTIHSREEMGEDGARYTRYWLGDDVDTGELLSCRRKKKR